MPQQFLVYLLRLDTIVPAALSRLKGSLVEAFPKLFKGTRAYFFGGDDVL